MPKVFQFRLQKVLDVKQQLEELMSVNLKKAQVELENEKQVAARLDEEKEAAFAAPEELGEISLTQMQLALAYIEQLNQMIERQNQVVAEQEKRVEENRTRLLKATQEKKVVEKLREKHFSDYRLVTRKKELNREGEVAQRIVMQKVKEREQV